MENMKEEDFVIFDDIQKITDLYIHVSSRLRKNRRLREDEEGKLSTKRIKIKRYEVITSQKPNHCGRAPVPST